MLTCIDVKFTFDSVFAMFLANSTSKQLNLVPRSSRLTVH